MHAVERGAGTPLVMIHGFGVDHRILTSLDPALGALGGWRRVYLDLPGTAGTPIGDVASTSDIADAVEHEIDKLLGDEPFAILGNSFGAMVARKVAHDLRPQVLGLATLAGVFVAQQRLRTLPSRTVLHEDPVAVRGAGAAALDYVEVAVEQHPEGVRTFLEHVHPGLTSVDRSALARIEQQYAFDVEPEDASPEPFMMPVLIVTARQDHVVGFEDASNRLEHYPRATFVILDAAGHNVHLDRPVVVEALIVDWLQRVRASRRTLGDR
ncbi:alpha/beta fold hydrolase [Sanguibacter antarcticus]|uniref:Pimeloyl-ACP methyl ester carboxylesterase n=1 Tax=Sanguibacter antarcticus TaxID=372484 RepID=A0A2A9E6Q9_9MICO|nr:alpha/beta hydrolase [Sanguibacter antarcticus]PFG33922.1 pimeloyl-ACP methyl ester carboxylesterase [Sanguibacter antarcticus]